MGKDCGYHYALNYADCYGISGAEWRVGCQKCCANSEACWPYDHVFGFWPLTRRVALRATVRTANAGLHPVRRVKGWYHEWGPDYENSYTEYPDTCEPWGTPTWAECTQNCGSARV